MAKKRFSIRNKLIIVFGLLIAVASLMEGTLAIRLARKAVIEKLEVQLIDHGNQFLSEGIKKEEKMLK